MTTQLENSFGIPTNSTATTPRFPIDEIAPALLSVIRSVMDGVVIVDSTRHIVLVNQKAEHMFGYRAAQLLERPLDVLLPARMSAEQRRYMDSLPLTHPRNRHSGLELRGRRSDGGRVSLRANSLRIRVNDELFVALILHGPLSSESRSDKHPLRATELRRRAASSQQATEVEKKRFSKKLYDDIGQRLSVLKLDLDWLENSLRDADEGLPARVAQMQGLLDNVITMTKNMASTLRPPLLDDFGLLAAVEWMAENFQKKSRVTCTVESTGLTEKLDDAIESAVFRVVQEGLSNIERHARASHAWVILQHVDGRLDVMIHDDGVGMESGSESKPGCYGLIAMQERVFALGGTISILNVAPHGVAIHASIPVEPIFPDDTSIHPTTPRL